MLRNYGKRWPSLVLAGCWVALLYQSAAGCSLIMQPVKGFDPQEYVFTGEVVRLAGPTRIGHVTGEAWGLAVKIEEALSLPQHPAKYFEVYPLALDADCSSSGQERETLLRSYPVGAKVRVIARAIQEAAPRAPAGVIRLSVMSWANQSIAPAEGAGPVSAPFDYKSYEWPEGPRAPASGPARVALAALPPYELRRDLRRLERASGEDEKAAVLERLLFYPYPEGLDFEGLTKNYLKDADLIRDLNRRRAAEAERLRQERQRRLRG